MRNERDLIQWAEIAFGDEFTFIVRPITQQRQVWRESERY